MSKILIPDNLFNKSWESEDINSIQDSLNTSQKGLTHEEAKKRAEQFGGNKLPDQKQDSKLKKFLIQFNNALIYVLIGAAILTAVLGHFIDTWIILAVVFINSIIGYVQEDKAQKALESIRHLLSLKSSVIRDDKRIEVPATELVPGDLVLLNSGDKVPADIRLIEVNNLRVEESSLTGESEAVEKSTKEVKEGTVIGERLSMVYTGTTVRRGSAKGYVVGIGEHTQLGKINTMLGETKAITTPLIRKINAFGKSLSIFIILFAIAVFIYGFFIADMDLSEISLSVIGLAVAAIPEGLPAILTITLAIGVQRMAKRNAIVRRLPSVETLGSVTVICSDKTGTLTKNEMTAINTYTADGDFEITGTGYEPSGELMLNNKPINPSDYKALYRLLQSSYLCNDSQITNENEQWQVEGAPTEGALMTMAKKSNIANISSKRLFTIPFDSEHKYMATLNDIDGEKYVFVNGAPERLLDKCKMQLSSKGENQDMDISYWEEKIKYGADLGQRMLGCAFMPIKNDIKEIEHSDLNNTLIFLGVVGLIDPPRPEAIEAIKLAKKAGIKIKMITGDHALTAKSIAKQMGIGKNDLVITGAKLENMSEDELKEAVKDCDVFARTSPENKLKLVSAIQANGDICAMTGDGVNDAPALKKADIGIAMGIKGTEVTKDSAAMVLADDNFASIISAVEEGRTIYDNLRKSLLFILPTNGAEALVILSALVLGITLPISPVQILWVNMVTAVTLGISLAFEPTEKYTMQKPPRNPKESILGKYFAFRILFVSVILGGITMYLFSFLNNDSNYSIQAARTIAVNTIVSGELFYLFNCRKINEFALGKGFFANKIAIITASALFIVQIGFTYLPFMNFLFDSVPIKPIYWVYSLIGGLVVFVVVEIEKIIKRRIFS